LILATAVIGSQITACKGIPFDAQTNTDNSPPAITLSVTGQSPSSTYNAQKKQFDAAIPIPAIEVGPLVPGMPVTPVSVQVHENGEASVLATAQDKESGIQSLKLSCQRQVFYNWDPANQTESNTILAPEVREQTHQVQNGYVPDKGILQQVLNMQAQMVFKNAAGTLTRGHRVGVTCSAEARNFRGLSVPSRALLVWAQDRTIQP
jgi:hypothetical protein